MSKIDYLPFNTWSKDRIAQGRKNCTSRGRKYVFDPRVYLIIKLPLHIVRDYLWREEGADSPEEFEKIFKGMHRGKFEDNKIVYAHFGDFREKP